MLPIIGIIVVMAGIALAVWLSFRSERMYRRELAERGSLNGDEFYKQYYADSGIPEDVPGRLRPIYSRFFDIEDGKLRPHDRPPEMNDLDTVDLVREIEAEFQIAISDKDAEQIDGSFDSIVRYLAANRAGDGNLRRAREAGR
jgi:hypothetical protein